MVEIRELRAKFNQQQAQLQALTCSLESASHSLLSHTSNTSGRAYGSPREEGGGNYRQFGRGGNNNYNNNFNNNNRRKYSHRQSGPPSFD